MTLLAPLFLAGLLAVGLPIWLHRLSSENPNRKPFSSLMFLEAGEPQRVLAKNVQYLLLLALRIAVLVLLVFAFVDPAYWRTPDVAAGDGARLHIVVVDQSASMAAGDRWDDAIDAAQDLVADLPSSDRAQLIAAGRTVELVTEPTLDRAVVRQGLASLDPGPFHVDFGQLTRALDGVIRNAELPVVLHFVTDAQATGLPTRFAELAPGAPAAIEVRAVGEPDAENWSIASLAGSAVSGEIVASLRSFAATERTQTVRLELNGGLVDEQSVTLAPGAFEQVAFPPLDLAEGSNRVTVTMRPGDTLAADDQRILALRRPVPRPVLVVAGDLRAQDSLFVASALETLEALALEVERVGPADLSTRDLSDYALIVVAEAAALSAAEAESLTDYVETGGGLLLGLGPRSTGLTTVPVTGQSFASATPSLTVSDEELAVGTMDTSHPILRGLDTLRTARFSRYTALTPGPDDAVLMSLDNGAPLLLERGLGNGRVLLFTSSLGKDWNDLALQPVFVPFVAGIANHLLGGAGFSNEAELGSLLALRAMGLAGGQIFDPSGQPALGLSGGTDDVLLDQIGFYELVGGGRTELVAVNFDDRESDLMPMDQSTTGRWQDLGRSSEVSPATLGAEPEPILAPLGRWLLLLLVIVVAMESLIGNWHLRVRRGMAA